MLSDNDVPRALLKKGNKHAYRNSPSKKIRLELKYPNLQKQKVEYSKSKAAKCIYDLKPHTPRNKKQSYHGSEQSLIRLFFILSLFSELFRELILNLSLILFQAQTEDP